MQLFLVAGGRWWVCFVRNVYIYFELNVSPLKKKLKYSRSYTQLNVNSGIDNNVLIGNANWFNIVSEMENENILYM